MVNVIPCVEAHQGNENEVVISVQGRVGIRLHGTVISEEVSIGDRQSVDNNNGVNYAEGSDIWNRGVMDSVELGSRVQNVVNDEEEMIESVRMDAGVENLTEERGNQVDTEGVMRDSDRVDAEDETKERDRVDAEGVTKERDWVDAEGVTKERDRVDAVGVTKERDRVDAEGVTKDRDRVDVEGVTKERDRVDAEGVTKERDRVDAEGVTKERDRVDAEGVTKERDRVDAVGVTKERDRVDAVGVTKERDRVDAEGVTKERDQVDAEGVTKERDRVDAEGVTKERDRVDAVGVTKERDRVDAEGVTKERDRVDAEGVTKERDRVDSEVVSKGRGPGDTNGVSAKVLAEQNSIMEQKASNYGNNNCGSHNHLQHYQSMDETGLSNYRRHLSSVTPHTPTRLTLFYKPSMLSTSVIKYFPKDVIVRAKGEHVSFGRSLDSDVQLNDDCMSRNYAVLWLPVNNCGTFKLRNISSSKEVVVNDVILYPNCKSEIIFTSDSKIMLDNIELTAMVREGSPSSTHYEVKVEPKISRSTSLQQEPTWMASSRNVGATAHQTEHVLSSHRRNLYAHSRFPSSGPVEHSLSNDVSRNLLPEEN
ncbi:kinesin-related protein 12 [Octopus vulgaris]|uniref:Kinesin-related protein 12 n=1 Tax=Octopus vulgaris TaxID=6645 RepID=A0AA36FMI1_OCTVU|nr:kinesin-related protein 12 [Octopus vulgaris]